MKCSRCGCESQNCKEEINRLTERVKELESNFAGYNNFERERLLEKELQAERDLLKEVYSMVDIEVQEIIEQRQAEGRYHSRNLRK